MRFREAHFDFFRLGFQPKLTHIQCTKTKQKKK